LTSTETLRYIIIIDLTIGICNIVAISNTNIQIFTPNEVLNAITLIWWRINIGLCRIYINCTVSYALIRNWIINQLLAIFLTKATLNDNNHQNS
jgi:hypothetical protein